MNQYLVKNRNGQFAIVQSTNRSLIGDPILSELPKFNGQPVLDVDVLDIESVSGVVVNVQVNPEKVTAKLAERMEQQLSDRKERLLDELEQIREQKLKRASITYNGKKISCSPDNLVNIMGQHKLIELGIKTDAKLTQTTGVRSTFNKADLENIGGLINTKNESIMAVYAQKLKAIHALENLNTEVDLQEGW